MPLPISTNMSQSDYKSAHLYTEEVAATNLYDTTQRTCLRTASAHLGGRVTVFAQQEVGEQLLLDVLVRHLVEHAVAGALLRVHADVKHLARNLLLQVRLFALRRRVRLHGGALFLAWCR